MPAVPFAVCALYEYEFEQDDDLPFDVGQVITVTEIPDPQWYFGHYTKDGQKLEGMFPVDYVELKAESAPAEPLSAPAATAVPVAAPKASNEPISAPVAEPVAEPLPSVPKPVHAPVEDDWGSDNEQESADEPIDEKPAAKHPIDSVQAELGGPKAEPVAAPKAEPQEVKHVEQAPQEAKEVKGLPKETPQEPKEIKETTTPHSPPASSDLSSNFKSRRGMFDAQPEPEKDTTAPVRRTNTGGSRLNFSFPESPEPKRREPEAEAEAAPPRVSIKERLALIQKQEQEMQQREEQERKRREQEDEKLRIEEELRNREREREQQSEEPERDEQSESEGESEEPSAAVQPPVPSAARPAIPKAPVAAPKERTPSQGANDEEEAHMIALRERMARISGAGNVGGISLGMMLGRNPEGASAPRKVKKKDISAMSDLERELYLASVEYEEAHGGEQEEVGGEEEQEGHGSASVQPESAPEESEETRELARNLDEASLHEIKQETPDETPADDGDTDTLIGARDTETETLAEDDEPVAVGAPTGAPTGPPTGTTPPRLVEETPRSLGSAPAVPGRSAAPTVPSAPGAPAVPSAPSAPSVPSAPTSTLAPPATSTVAPSGTPLPSCQTTDLGLATEEQSSSEDEFSDASESLPVAPPRTNPILSTRQQELHTVVSDSETAYEADEEKEETRTLDPAAAPVPPVPAAAPAAPTTSRAPPPPPKAPATPSAPPVPTSTRPPAAAPGAAPAVPAVPAVPPATATAPSAPPAVPIQHASTFSAPPVPRVQSPPIPSRAPTFPPNVPPAAPPAVPQTPPPVPRTAPQVPAHAPAIPRVQSPTIKSPPVPQSPPRKAPVAPVAAPVAPTSAPTSHELGRHRSTRSIGSTGEFDLEQETLWFTKERGLPSSVDPKKVLVEFENSEANKRGRIVKHHDVYIVNSDLSQVHINVAYDEQQPARAQVSQQVVPPPKVDAAELIKYSQSIGAQVHGLAAKQAHAVQHTSAFVKSLVDQIPAALPPIRGTFGLSIYENFGGASVHQTDAIRPGDIAVFVEANFAGTKGPLQKYHKTVANSVYVVQEFDGTKKKLHVFDAKKESFRFGDLQSGLIKIYRVLGRDIVGW